MGRRNPDRTDARRSAGLLENSPPTVMKVLVTGGTGYLGRAVLRALAARGHDPVVFTRTATISGLPGAIVTGDIRDRAAIARAAHGCDAICHMAALVSICRPARGISARGTAAGRDTCFAPPAQTASPAGSTPWPSPARPPPGNPRPTA